MPKLSQSQMDILTAASQRHDGAVLPVPLAVKLKGALLTRTLQALLKHKLIKERPATRGSETWRKAPSGRRMTLSISEAGLKAVIASADKRPKLHAVASRYPADKPSGKRRQRPKLRVVKSAPPLRTNSKQMEIVRLLEREAGANVIEIAERTGWQPHTIRAAISSVVRKKLGFKVETSVHAQRGRVYHIVR